MTTTTPSIDNERSTRRAGITVNDLHRHLKEMVVLFKIKPGTRINEKALADHFGVSRTPLREALHRLVAENMLVMIPNKGFYGRELASQEVFDLYELRSALESTAVLLALTRAAQSDIEAVRDAWIKVVERSHELTTHELLLEDEKFHISLAALSGNQEIVKSLQAINERIHYFRWSDIEDKGDATGNEHLELISALLQRDQTRCQELIGAHITRRMDEIVRFIKTSVVRIYANNI